MNFQPSSLTVLIGFLVLVAWVFGALLYGAYKGDYKSFKRTTIFLVAWNILASLLVISGLIAEKFIPFGLVLFASVNLTALFFSFSQFSKPYFNLPLWWLAFFQCFRLPLEIILHNWASTGTVPSTMTWTGENWDVVSGILALTVLVPALRNKKYIWFVNGVGIILLLNVLRVVILSSPVPFGWNLDNPIQLIAFFPYQFIATICVWGAIVGHIILTRRLLQE